jgi:L,D-transpeptidase catalytic domain
VIRPEQLAVALDRLDPRDRELLSLSLRRRVPDEALARLYQCETSEVARRRARAIERLADEMELQRGEDLGAVLKALLEPNTWSSAVAAPGEEFAVGGGGMRLAAVPAPGGPEPTGLPALTPVPPPEERVPGAQERVARGESEAAAAEGEEPAAEGDAAPPEPAADEASPATEPKVVTVPTEPVLEMLAAREREAPDRPRRAVAFALLGLGVAALVGAAGVIGATQFGEGERVVQRPGTGTGGGDAGPRHFVPERTGPMAAPFPSDPRTMTCYSTAYVRRTTTLYREPGGRPRLKLLRRTEWGSPRVLGVLKQRGDWLGVQAPELRNGEIAWLRKSEARLDCARWSLHADLSKKSLFVRRDGHTVRKMSVAIGRPGNPTPQGRFTVTDKLRVTDPNSPYGCCVLALTGHQTRLPPGWPGGDRLAVHATKDIASIGQAVSLGCLRADPRQVKWLINTIPLGAPIFIRA